MERSRLGGLTPASVANVDFFGADIMDNCLVMTHDRKVRYLRGIKRDCVSHRYRGEPRGGRPLIGKVLLWIIILGKAQIITTEVIWSSHQF